MPPPDNFEESALHQIPFRSPDHSWHHDSQSVESSKKPLLNHQGEICGIIGITGPFDQAHFSREFSRILKEPPSAYRARYRL